MLPIAVQLQTILRRSLARLPEPPAEDFDASVLPAADARFGDYQANAAMTLAKARRMNPRALATQIVELLNADPELAAVAAPLEIAGAGFINFRLLPEYLAERLAALLSDPERLGVPLPARKCKVVLDFSSPNIAKPMHVGHLRSTIIGECLARVARFIGHEVITDNHLGDWGTQFGKVIFGWKNFLDQTALAVDPLAELVRVYQKAHQLTEVKNVAEDFMGDSTAGIPALSPEATAQRMADACREELVKLQAGDPENLAIWRQCVDLSLVGLNKIYARLGVYFDHQFGESYFDPKLAPLVERLQQSGIAQPSEGALVVFFPDIPKLTDKPAIIRKRDGAFNYATTDIATYEQRVNEFGADALWYVVGSPQALHFEQINAIIQKMGYNVPLTHIPFGSILGEDRKIMRTRNTREGSSVALLDLLDEAEERARAILDKRESEGKAAALESGRAAVAAMLDNDEDKKEVARVIGLGAVKYAELSQGRLTDYIFSWDKMLSFQGNTAPYLQNAYVRIRSIFRRGEIDSDDLSSFIVVAARPVTDSSHPSSFILTEPAERDLARKLAQFGEAVPTILEDFRPNLLANYLYDLAGAFHGFFEACPVLKSEGAQRETRLVLCWATMRVLRQGLGLMGIDVPERM